MPRPSPSPPPRPIGGGGGYQSDRDRDIHRDRIYDSRYRGDPRDRDYGRRRGVDERERDRYDSPRYRYEPSGPPPFAGGGGGGGGRRREPSPHSYRDDRRPPIGSASGSGIGIGIGIGPGPARAPSFKSAGGLDYGDASSSSTERDRMVKARISRSPPPSSSSHYRYEDDRRPMHHYRDREDEYRRRSGPYDRERDSYAGLHREDGWSRRVGRPGTRSPPSSQQSLPPHLTSRRMSPRPIPVHSPKELLLKPKEEPAENSADLSEEEGMITPPPSKVKREREPSPVAVAVAVAVAVKREPSPSPPPPPSLPLPPLVAAPAAVTAPRPKRVGDEEPESASPVRKKLRIQDAEQEPSHARGRSPTPPHTAVPSIPARRPRSPSPILRRPSLRSPSRSSRSDSRSRSSSRSRSRSRSHSRSRSSRSRSPAPPTGPSLYRKYGGRPPPPGSSVSAVTASLNLSHPHPHPHPLPNHTLPTAPRGLPLGPSRGRAFHPPTGPRSDYMQRLPPMIPRGPRAETQLDWKSREEMRKASLESLKTQSQQQQSQHQAQTHLPPAAPPSIQQQLSPMAVDVKPLQSNSELRAASPITEPPIKTSSSPMTPYAADSQAVATMSASRSSSISGVGVGAKVEPVVGSPYGLQRPSTDGIPSRSSSRGAGTTSGASAGLQQTPVRSGVNPYATKTPLQQQQQGQPHPHMHPHQPTPTQAQQQQHQQQQQPAAPPRSMRGWRPTPAPIAQKYCHWKGTIESYSIKRIMIGETARDFAPHPTLHTGGHTQDWEDRIIALRNDRAKLTHDFQALAAGLRLKRYDLALAEDELIAARLRTEAADITYDNLGSLV